MPSEAIRPSSAGPIRLPAGQRHGAAGQILAGAAGILAVSLAGRDEDRARLKPRHFLDDNRVGAGRQHGAGHDAHRLPLADLAGEGIAGEGGADHAQARFTLAARLSKQMA